MRKLCLILFCTLFLVSCGYQTGVIQKAEKGYLRFSGSWDTDEVAVYVSDMQPFKLKPNDQTTLFEITPGKHFLKVVRGNNVVVDRVVFVESQATYEVKVP